jgi:hypothetical protein
MAFDNQMNNAKSANTVDILSPPCVIGKFSKAAKPSI